jgi:hypothetical protein
VIVFTVLIERKLIKEMFAYLLGRGRGTLPGLATPAPEQPAGA